MSLVFEPFQAPLAKLPWRGVGRVSSRNFRAGESYHSKPSQVALIEQGAARFGITVDRVDFDEDVKGVDFDRRGLNIALEDIKVGRVGGIVFPYISRSGRLTRENIELIARIGAAGGQVIFGQEGMSLTSDMEWTAFQMQSVFAEQQWRHARTNWRDTALRNVRRGRATRPVFGYVKAASPFEYAGRGYPEGALIPSPNRPPGSALTEAEAAREAFVMRSAGHSVSGIARWLNEEGFRTRVRKRGPDKAGEGGNPFTRAGIHSLLACRTYLGEVAWRGKCSRHSVRQEDCQGCLATPLEVNPEAHPALVTPVEWQSAAARVVPRGPNQAARGEPALLQGIARCAGCGYSLARVSDQWSSNYGCAGSGPWGCDARGTARQNVLDAYVERLLLEWWNDQRRVFHPQAEELAEPDGLLDALTEARQRRDKVLGNEEMKADDYAGWKQSLSHWTRKVQAAEASVAASRSRFDDIPPVQVVDEWTEGRLSVAEKRRLVVQAVGAVLVGTKARGTPTGLLGAAPKPGPVRDLDERVLLIPALEFVEGRYASLFPKPGYNGGGNLPCHFRWKVDPEGAGMVLQHDERKSP